MRVVACCESTKRRHHIVFELPLGTTLLVFGFPLFWVLYTVIFLHRTRRWKDEEKREETR